jgi:hypothetical protein
MHEITALPVRTDTIKIICLARCIFLTTDLQGKCRIARVRGLSIFGKSRVENLADS